ncbi:MAG TPA: YifB family Mg chelatase-like AAA ATPase [Solirubrobacteraceae bacterium]|nr:YifB family Mg chelatase-like AAA ATPase [Solirubrobacteraceae bacterium]
MLARARTFAIDGVEPRQVWVEVDIRSGLPAFSIVGLGDTAVRESRERIRAAILNSGFRFPDGRITANLAPASLRKAGPGFDAALALALLAASGQLSADRLGCFAVFGELSLGGELRDSPGALAVAEGARRFGVPRLIVPPSRAREASLVDGVEVAPADGLACAAAIISGERAPAPVPRPAANGPAAGVGAAGAGIDLADVRGHAIPLLALQIAAAGGHNLLMQGAPGTGKTMLARRLATILPQLTRAEALEVTRIHSIAGLHADGLMTARPFRAPHHTISPAGLAGGGSPPRPGEASLAHHGILFLDELSEFQRSSLDALRQPLEDGHVTIVRGQRALRFPTGFQLVAATNPCPCGFAGVDDRCGCAESDLRRHQRRLSGPLLDRIDLLVDVRRPSAQELRAPPQTSSARARELVEEARERQRRRLRGTAAGRNGELDAGLVRRTVRLDADAEEQLSRAYACGLLSPRGRHRTLRVARTIADLAGRERVSRDDVMLALSLRHRADPGREAAA